MADLGPNDLPLSKATPAQIVEALDERGLATLLIALPWEQITDFDDLVGVDVKINFPDSMTSENFQSIILLLAASIMSQRRS